MTATLTVVLKGEFLVSPIKQSNDCLLSLFQVARLRGASGNWRARVEEAEKQ
jgi:hypothetical protein